MGFQASCKQAFLAKPEVENRRTVTESKVELIVKEPTNFSSVFQQSVQHNFPRHVASIHFEFESSTFINCWLQHRVPTITSREIVRKKKYSSFYFLNPCSPKTATWSIFHPLFKGPNRRNLKAGVEVDVVPNGSVVNYKHRHFITCTDTSFQTCSMLSMHANQFCLTTLKTGQLLFEDDGFGVKVDRTAGNLCLVAQTFHVMLSSFLFVPKCAHISLLCAAVFLRYIPMQTYIHTLMHKQLELVANIIMAWAQNQDFICT